MVGQTFFCHAVGSFGELQQFHRQGTFFCCLQRQCGLCVVGFHSAENAFNPCVSVLQIRRGIAFKTEHGIPVEDVIRVAIFGKVGVFHRTNTDGMRNGVAFGFGQFGVFRADQGKGAFFGFG